MNEFRKLKRDYIEGKKIIFFDFFDTIVHRKCNPAEIKRIWAYRISHIINYSYEPELILKTRLESEKDLEKMFGQAYDYGQLINRIIQRLQTYSELKQISFVTNEEALQIEKEIEEQFLYLDSEILEILNLCNDLKKDIYIVSDYHLGKDVIGYYLDKLRIKNYFKKIYISCDCKKSKYSGELYEYVLQQLQHAAEECLMIGDNEHSDIKNSKKYGIAAYHKKNVLNNDIKKNIFESFLQKENVKNDYSGFCFSLSLFTEKLYIALKKSNATKVYFLSREGEFLKDLFDVYLKIQEDNTIETKYLYVSRQSTFLASLDINLDNESFHNLFRQFNNISAKKFMLNLDFPEEIILKIQEETKIDINIEIADFSHSDCLKVIKADGTFRKSYEKVVQSQKMMFKRYLEQEGYNIGEPLNIVDVGWKGTIQDNISNVLPNTNINGYYVGLGELGWDEVKDNNIKKGVLFSVVPYQTSLDEKLALDAGLFEKILYASHASTSRYEEQHGVVVPVFKYYETENEVYNIIRPIQDIIKEKSIEIFSFFKEHGSLLSEYSLTFTNLHIKTILGMNYDKVAFRIKVEEKHFENFGTFDTVNVGKISDNFSMKKNKRYVINRLKQVFVPEFFIRNCYHFRNIKSGLFWKMYSGIIIKKVIKEISV